MEFGLNVFTAVVVCTTLFLVLLVPYLIWEIRRGKAEGHTWFTWWKPAGHSDIGPDTGPRQTTRDGVDQGRVARV